MTTPKNIHKIFIPKKKNSLFFLKTLQNIKNQSFEPKNIARGYICIKISESEYPRALSSLTRRLNNQKGLKITIYNDITKPNTKPVPTQTHNGLTGGTIEPCNAFQVTLQTVETGERSFKICYSYKCVHYISAKITLVSSVSIFVGE